MPTNLYAIHLWTNMIGVMDHPMRKPKQPLFDGLQMLRIGHDEHFRSGVSNVAVHPRGDPLTTDSPQYMMVS